MRNLLVLLLVLEGLFGGMAWAQSVPEPAKPGLPPVEEIGPQLKSFLESGSFSDICVVLSSRGGEPVFLCESSPGGTTANPETRFDVGTVSQSFLAIGLMRLSERGMPVVDSRLDTLVPDLPVQNPWASNEPLRVEHLLEHTAGFQDLPLREFASTSETSGSIRETLLRDSSALVCLNRPGRFSDPVTTGPMVAALVAEEVSRQPFEDWIQNAVFQPLHMSARYRHGEAVGASRRGADLWPVFGLEASSRDLSVALQMFLDRGKVEGADYLSLSQVQRLETPATSDAFRNGLQVGFGLGIRTFPANGFVFYGAQSGLDSDYAAFRYLPQHGLGFAVLARGPSGANFSGLVSSLERFCTSNLEPPQPLFVDLPANRLAAVDGYYRPLTFRWGWTGFALRILDVDYIEYLQGKLLVDSPGGSEVQLFPVTDRRFRAEGEPLPTVVFSRGGDGRTVVEGFSEYFQGNFFRASGGLVWLERIGGVISLGVLAAWLAFAIFSCVWTFVRGKSRSVDLLLLALPSLAALSVAAVVVPLIIGREDLVSSFGRLTWISGLLFIGSLACPVTAVVALGGVLLRWRSHSSSNVWLFSLVAALSALLVAGYLVYWGVFGLRTWA